MKRWDRTVAEGRVQRRLWTYLAGDAVRSSLPSSVEDIWQLQPGELRRLASAHLATSPDAENMLDAARRILHVLPSSLAAAETVLHGVVRGPVAWARTQQLRVNANDPTLFVCRPPERRYDSPLARLVKLALTTLVDAGEAASDLSGRGETALRRTDNLAIARELLAHRKLHDVELVRHLSPRTLNALRRRSDTSACIAYVEAARGALHDSDPVAIAEVISTQLLAPASDDVLYELVAGFGLIDALEERGFHASRSSALRGSNRPFALMRRSTTTATLWWQRSIRELYPHIGGTSEYSRTLAAAGMTASSLGPDFVLEVREDGDVEPMLLVVEVKHTMRDDHTPERRGIVDALAYLRDLDRYFSGRPEPHALVVAWNATGRPSRSSIVVADEDTIGEALDVSLEMPTTFAPASSV